MQPEIRIWRIEPVRVFFDETSIIGGTQMSQASEITCSNCHSRMPSDLRFCRNCGFRLPQSMAGYGVGQYSPSDELPTVTPLPAQSKKKRRISGMSWIFVALIVFFVGAAAFTAIVAPMRKNPSFGFTQIPVNKSYLGVDRFSNTDEGVILESVRAPGGPDRKSTRLNSSHGYISYAVFCLKR